MIDFLKIYKSTLRIRMVEEAIANRYQVNGTEQKMSDECPGPEWRLGMINASGARWWTNGVADHRSKEPPGPEWKLGRINVRKTYSKKSVV